MNWIKKNYKFFESILLSVIGLVVYNCVIQFFTYPTINKVLGDNEFGNFLTIMSVLSVVTVSCGVGTNYSRMATSPKFESSNGDYNRVLSVCAVFCVVISVASGIIISNASPVSLILISVACIGLMLRYYADVEYRLKINYRMYLVYYLILSVGYVIGTFVFKLTGYWASAFIVAEFSAVLFVTITGTVFKRPLLKASNNHKAVSKSCSQLIGSQIFSSIIINSDRILINAFMTGSDVTCFYTASLLGKSMAMLTGPFNGVIIGYLAKYEKQITKKFYGLCVLASLAASLLIFLVLIPITPFLIKLLYPSVYSTAEPYFIIANCGQIVYFISNLLLVIALRFMSERFQLAINAIYTVIYFALCIFSLMQNNMLYFVLSVLTANVIRMVIIIIAGFIKAKPNE